MTRAEEEREGIDEVALPFLELVGVGVGVDVSGVVWPVSAAGDSPTVGFLFFFAIAHGRSQGGEGTKSVGDRRGRESAA